MPPLAILLPVTALLTALWWRSALASNPAASWSWIWSKLHCLGRVRDLALQLWRGVVFGVSRPGFLEAGDGKL